MKNLLLTTVLIFTPYLLFAQLDIKLNLARTASQKPEIDLEMGYDKFSIEFGNGLILQKWGQATLVDSEGNETEVGVKRFGYNGTLRANFYLNPIESIDGWYVSPFASYRSQKIEFENPVKNKRVGAAVVLGRKGLVFDQFGYSVEGGIGYWFINSYKNNQGDSAPVYQDAFLFADLLQKLDKFMLPFSASIYYRIGG